MLTSCEVKLVSQICDAGVPQRSLGLRLQEVSTAWIQLLPPLQMRIWPAVWWSNQYLPKLSYFVVRGSKCSALSGLL